jgi:diacylglycerol kinase family enzyme
MRAILVVNPKATTTSELSRDVLVRALRSELDIRVEYTRRRGHAADLAREARDEQVDVVITLGGDGTVNEVVNGLLQDGPWESGDVAGRGNTDKVPALAVVPGGSTNVFARALGLPRDAVEGTGVILDALHNGRVRSVGLGRADGRYFTFCAGFGLDAEVVRKVERARLRGRVSTPGLYLRSTVAQFLLDSDRKTPMITLECPGEETQQEIASVIIQNTAPWTFLGDRPINSCPDASFDTGLDLMAMKALRLPATARTVTQLLSRRGNPHGKQVMTLHDLPEFTLRAVRPMAFQLDGDYLGERSKITFTSMPGALRVFC